jgi:hypothetical protein
MAGVGILQHSITFIGFQRSKSSHLCWNPTSLDSGDLNDCIPAIWPERLDSGRLARMWHEWPDSDQLFCTGFPPFWPDSDYFFRNPTNSDSNEIVQIPAIVAGILPVNDKISLPVNFFFLLIFLY